MIERMHFLILIVVIALWEKHMKHEGREDVQRNEGIYIFRVLHILHVFVFKILFLNMHRRVNVFLIDTWNKIKLLATF